MAVTKNEWVEPISYEVETGLLPAQLVEQGQKKSAKKTTNFTGFSTILIAISF